MNAREDSPAVFPVHDADNKLIRAIGLPGATSLVIGNVIGSAVFLTTGIIVDRMPSVSLLLIAWVTGGLLAFCGGLTLAEMSAMYPHSGGWYIYLNEAYGPVWGFLFGWAGMLVMMTGSVAAVAVGFAEYFSYFFPSLSTSHTIVSFPVPWGRYSISAGQMIAAGSIALLGALNYVGVRIGNAVQSIFTALKIAALAAIPMLALALWRVAPAFHPIASNVPRPLSSFGIAMIAVMWAYSGWDYLCFASGEIKNPSRNLPRALIFGIGALVTLYLAVNLGYVYSMHLEEMRGVVRIAERSVTAMVGAVGASLVAGAVMISTFGCNASSIIPISRVCYAMSADGLFVRAAAAVHPKFRTPHIAIALTCGWSALLALSGTYEQLYTYVVFTALIFNVAGGLAVFRLRHVRPDRPRPYRVWGYPVIPAIFVLATGFLLVNTLIERPVESIIGILLLLLGIPIYLRRTKAKGVDA